MGVEAVQSIEIDELVAAIDEKMFPEMAGRLLGVGLRRPTRIIHGLNALTPIPDRTSASPPSTSTLRKWIGRLARVSNI
jgi:hypothetical protein